MFTCFCRWSCYKRQIEWCTALWHSTQYIRAKAIFGWNLIFAPLQSEKKENIVGMERYSAQVTLFLFDKCFGMKVLRTFFSVFLSLQNEWHGTSQRIRNLQTVMIFREWFTMGFVYSIMDVLELIIGLLSLLLIHLTSDVTSRRYKYEKYVLDPNVSSFYQFLFYNEQAAPSNKVVLIWWLLWVMFWYTSCTLASSAIFIIMKHF